MHSAMRASDSSTVAAPTVDPGLAETGNVIYSHVKHRRIDLLEVVQLKAELFASLQIVEEALIRLFPLLATSLEMKLTTTTHQVNGHTCPGFPD